MNIHLTDADTYFVGLMSSHKERCPRQDCGAAMTATAEEHCMVYECPQGHYRVKETSGEMKAKFASAVRGMR